jgi:GST-like protein
MTESAAILIHLADAHPGSGLLPADPSARAQAIRGLVFIAAQCYAAIGVIDYPESWCADCDEATAGRIRAGTRAHLETARPAFHALLQSIEAHPRVAPVLARHWPPPEACRRPR